MGFTRRAVLGAAATVSIAGCIGGQDDSEGGGTSPGTDDGTGSPTDSSTETPTATGSDGDRSATVQVQSHDDLGELLVGPEGMTLYMFDQDTQGEGASACVSDCANAWPPLTVEDSSTAGSAVTAELTTFEREDGSIQVAANGWPLYYFASDESPGDVNGQGANDIWWVLDPAGVPVRSSGTPTPTESTDSATGQY